MNFELRDNTGMSIQSRFLLDIHIFYFMQFNKDCENLKCCVCDSVCLLIILGHIEVCVCVWKKEEENTDSEL